MNDVDILDATWGAEPEVGLRESAALHSLAEMVGGHVALARSRDWSWQQIGDAFAVTRQSVQTKYGKKVS